MPYAYKHRRPPATWKDFHPAPLHPYLLPLSYTNWAGEWMAYILGKWSIFEVLDYVGSFSILIAVIFYFADSGDRLKMKHYQAWQVINTAQGKGGSGGRMDALQELNEDGVPLVGVDVSDAYLQNLRLTYADLHRANFSGTDLRNAVLKHSKLQDSNFDSANLRGSDISSVNFTAADFTDADLNDADLHETDVSKANFLRADLRGVDFANVLNWREIKSIELANVHGVRNADDFVAWAKSQGAVDIADDADYEKKLKLAESATSQPAE